MDGMTAVLQRAAGILGRLGGRLAMATASFGLMASLGCLGNPNGETATEESWDSIIARECPEPAVVPEGPTTELTPERTGQKHPCADKADHADIIGHIDQSLEMPVDVDTSSVAAEE